MTDIPNIETTTAKCHICQGRYPHPVTWTAITADGQMVGLCAACVDDGVRLRWTLRRIEAPAP